MTLLAWDEITQSESWRALTPPQKTKVYLGYKRDLGKENAWKNLTGDEKFQIARAMEIDAGFNKEPEEPSFYEKYIKQPYVEPIQEIAKPIPGPIPQIPEQPIMTNAQIPFPPMVKQIGPSIPQTQISPEAIAPEPEQISPETISARQMPFNEAEFQRWYQEISQQLGLNPDPDDPRHFYDYRAAYQTGVRGPDETGHWPSQFKTEGHPNLVIGGVDTRTGQPIEKKPIPMAQPQQPLLPSETSPLATIPYMALKSLRGLTHPLFAPLAGTPVDTNKLIEDAIRYWEQRTPEMGAIPDIGIGPKGLERREIPVKELLGGTAETAGAIAGPVRAGFKAGGLITELPQILAKARPFYRSIMRGMIAGALVGEGEPEQTLQDMALFGVLEPIAYGVGKIIEAPKLIRESTIWRKMTIKERGLILQSLDDTIQKNPDISEGEILRQWNNPQWRKEALEKRGEPEVKPIPKAKETGAETVYPEEETTPEMPKLQSTREAWEFGEKATPEQVKRLKELAEEETRKSAELRATGDVEDLKKAGDHAFQVQFYHEAIAKAEGTAPPIPGEAEKPPTPVKEGAPPERHRSYLPMMRQEVLEGRGPETLKFEGEYGHPEYRRTGSTYPEWMKNKGWTGKEVEIALQKGMKGEKLGPRQEIIFDSALSEARDRFLRDAKEHGRMRKEAIEEAKANGIKERDLQESIQREAEEEVAQEAEFARLEREAIQEEGNSLSREDISFKSEEIEPAEKPTPEIIPYSKDLNIRNIEQLPRGVGTPYLEVIEGEKGTYIAKQWRRKPQDKGIFVEFEKPIPIPDNKHSKLMPYTKRADTANQILMDKNGVVYEGRGEEHVEILKHFKLNPDDITNAGMINMHGNYVWKGVEGRIEDYRRLWKDALARRERGEPEVLKEKRGIVGIKPAPKVEEALNKSPKSATIPLVPKKPGKAAEPTAETPKAEGGLYKARGLEEAKTIREEQGSLATYDLQSQKEWLGNQNPPKDGKIILYRATPEGKEIKPGDYVTNSREYAEGHIEANLGGEGKITSIDATLDDIFPADGPKEFWYAPKSIEKPKAEGGEEKVKLFREYGATVKGNKVILYRGGDVSKDELRNLRYGDYLSASEKGPDITGNEGADAYGKNVVRLELPLEEVEITGAGEFQYKGQAESLKSGTKYPEAIYKAFNDYYGSNFTAKEVDKENETEVRNVASMALEGGRKEFDELMAKHLPKPSRPPLEGGQESLIKEEAPFELTREQAPPKTLGPQHKKAVFPEGKIPTGTIGKQKGILPEFEETKKGETHEIPLATKKTVREKEAELGKQTNEAIGDVVLPVGLSIKAIPSKTPIKSEYGFVDKSVEKRFKESQGVKGESFLTKAVDTIVSLKNKLTRDLYEHLPKTREFAQLRFDLLKLAKQRSVASDRTLRSIQGITAKMEPEDYNLFSRKVILDDLMETMAEGKDLPFGFTKELLPIENTRLEHTIAANKAVLDAVKQRKELWDVIKSDYTGAMKAIGFDVSDKLTRKNYYRHQVLEYINAKGLFGTGQRLRVPTKRGFLKKRMGSELDINSNYIQAEHEVMAQMLYDIEVADTIKNVDKYYNIADRLKKEAKKLNNPEITWRDLIPEDYVPWQPREGNVFYLADSIPANIAEQLASGKLEELGITAEQLHKTLAMGGKFKEFVVKKEIAETLDNLVGQKSQNVIAQAHKKLIRSWKVWQLISPRRFFKYNTRNLTGDADGAFAGNPGGFKKVPQAISDLYEVFVGDKAMSENMKDWFERGGVASTLQAQEMGQLNELKMFERFLDKSREKKLTDIPAKAWNEYWKIARMSTDFRESILRYANYLHYLEQMKESPDGLPKNYGASKPEEIKGLHDIKDRAYWLSNDLLGAYDRISVVGHALREHLYPFWSWKEVNFKRYKQLFKNAASDKDLSSTVGRKLLGTIATTPFKAYRIGKFAIKALAFWTALQVWNNTRFPDEEDDLPKNVKNRPHIVLGRNEEGEVEYFSRVGALPDLFEWFDLDNAPHYIDAWSKGRMSLKEIAQDMAKAPVNVIVQGGEPVMKMGAEIITRRSLFPDIFSPGTIRDRGLHIARGLGLDNEYKVLAGKPSRPYKKSIFGFFAYKVDPLEAAYRDIWNEKKSYLKKLGKYGEGFWITPRGNALYNARLALRYKDQQAATEYMAKYITLSNITTEKDLKKAMQSIERSLDSLDPMNGLTEQEQLGFVLFLAGEKATKEIIKSGKIDPTKFTEEIKQSDSIQTLIKAIKYYQELRHPEFKLDEKNDRELKPIPLQNKSKPKMKPIPLAGGK